VTLCNSRYSISPYQPFRTASANHDEPNLRPVAKPLLTDQSALRAAGRAEVGLATSTLATAPGEFEH
jgi:hypothetical protein